MSLLRELNNALSKFDGNLILMKERDYAEYYCIACKERFHEDEYVEKYSMCCKCLHKNDEK